MTDSIIINVPFYKNSPGVGYFIVPFALSLIVPAIFKDQIIIENGLLKYKASILSTKQEKIFKLKEIVKILLKKKVTPLWSKDLKLNVWGRPGKKVELYLVDSKNLEHLIIPSVIIDADEKLWKQFIDELCRYSGLPLEDIGETDTSTNLFS